jgi:isopentenyl-diphosphate delta-isomerase
MELIDVVDENCNILYQTTKQKAHKLGLLHRTIIAEIMDSQGRCMLVKQSSKRQDANCYVSPVGGHMRYGETEEEALKREAKEEVGLSNFKHKYIGRIIFNRDVLGRIENHYFILYEIYSDAIPKLNHESIDYKYFTKDELKKSLKEKPELFGAAFFPIIENFYKDLLG